MNIIKWSYDKLQPVQHGLSRENSWLLQTIWLEEPPFCNLACRYCYANGWEMNEIEKSLNLQNYKSILEQFKKLWWDSLGIPGAWEPFIPKNLPLTLILLEECQKLWIFVTIFTTTEFVTEELACKLLNLPCEIMIKCNSLDPDVQDAFVSDEEKGRKIGGYWKIRNEKIQLLMKLWFNNEKIIMDTYWRKSRMALVTSIMTEESGNLSNVKDIEEIFRFCRDNNIIFDCDSVLERWRWANCWLSIWDNQRIELWKKMQKIDREEYWFDREIAQWYVWWTICDRYMHHLYVDWKWNCRPCIWATGVRLWNIKENTLEEMRNSKAIHVIRNRKYGWVCGEKCANFAEKLCNSCLWRCCDPTKLTKEFLEKKWFVPTIWCSRNHRPKNI